MAAIEVYVTNATFEKITAAQLQWPLEQQQNIGVVLDVIATLAKPKNNAWVYRKAFHAYKQQTDQTFKQFIPKLSKLRLCVNLIKIFVKTIKFVQLTNVY